MTDPVEENQSKILFITVNANGTKREANPAANWNGRNATLLLAQGSGYLKIRIAGVPGRLELYAAVLGSWR